MRYVAAIGMKKLSGIEREFINRACVANPLRPRANCSLVINASRRVGGSKSFETRAGVGMSRARNVISGAFQIADRWN